MTSTHSSPTTTITLDREKIRQQAAHTSLLNNERALQNCRDDIRKRAVIRSIIDISRIDDGDNNNASFPTSPQQRPSSNIARQIATSPQASPQPRLNFLFFALGGKQPQKRHNKSPALILAALRTLENCPSRHSRVQLSIPIAERYALLHCRQKSLRYFHLATEEIPYPSSSSSSLRRDDNDDVDDDNNNAVAARRRMERASPSRREIYAAREERNAREDRSAFDNWQRVRTRRGHFAIAGDLLLRRRGRRRTVGGNDSDRELAAASMEEEQREIVRRFNSWLSLCSSEVDRVASLCLISDVLSVFEGAVTTRRSATNFVLEPLEEFHLEVLEEIRTERSSTAGETHDATRLSRLGRLYCRKGEYDESLKVFAENHEVEESKTNDEKRKGGDGLEIK